MANPNPSFQSKRVKKRNQLGITSDRYEFLGLDQAEPDLGDPTVGVSSVGVNPFTVDLGEPYVLVSDNSGTGRRFWTQRANIIAGGIVQPGAISIYNDGDLAPGTTELSIFKLNFTGAGVTVIGVGSDRADVDITVTDVSLFTGQTGSVAYKDSNGLAQAANSFIFNPINNNVGISSTQPTEKLDVSGNIKVSGDISVGSSLTANKIKAGSFEVDNFIINENTIVFKVTTDSVGIGTTLPISTLDVRGTTNISGYTTVGGLESKTELISQTLGVSSIASVGSLNIDSTQVISSSRELQNITSLDEITTSTIETAIANTPNTFTDLNVTGVSTLATLGVAGLTTTKDLNVSGFSTTLHLNVTESAEINDLNVSGFSTTLHLNVTESTEIKDLNVSGVSTLATLEVVGLTTTKDLNVSGISTLNDVYINAGKIVSIASSVGIGTTVAKYELDLNGDLNLTGILNLNGDPGTDGKVLLSKGGANSPVWGDAAGVNVGSATSVTTIDKDGVDEIYNLAFVSQTFGSINQSISLDSNNLYYNPLSNSLGIGTTELNFNLNVSGSTLLDGVNLLSGITTISGSSLDIDVFGLRYDSGNTRLGIGSTNPQVELDVDGDINATGTLTIKDIVVEGFTRTTTGILTTSTKNEAVVDNLDTNTFRSARYNIQVNTIGQLTLNNGDSVTSLVSGTNYYPGIYNDVQLTNVSSSGIDARANITVSPEASLSIVGSFSGLFTTEESTLGIVTSQSLILDQVVPPSEFENSRVTNVDLNLVGSGYTVVPSFTFDAPIIEGNPIEGVGVGSTATGIVNSMKVSNFIFGNSGFITSIVPSVTIDAPISGTQATANVGYGISAVTLSGFSSSTGIGYLSIPSVNFSSGSASAQVSSLFVNRLRVTNPGYGYTIGDLGTTIVFSSGAAAATNNSFSLPNSHLGFSISNPGAGYTAPPILTVSSPQIGVNTGIATCTLGISTFTVTSPGSGYTVSPTITNSPSVTGFSGYVGMGISDFALQLSGGGGYDSNPTVEIVAVGGIGTGAQATAQINIAGLVESVTIINPGYGYTVPPLVVFSGGTPEVSAAATIRTLVATNVVINNTGYGVTQVAISTVGETITEFLDNPLTRTGIVGIATTSLVSDVIFSAEGTLGTASTTIISGISTFNTIIREKTGNLDSINDFTITGIDTSNVSVGFAVTGNFVQVGTAVSFVGSSTIGLTQNLTNPSVGFGLTFYVSDILSSRVIVGQGVSGTSIDQTGYGTTIISIGSSEVILSRETTNTGIETNTFYFGSLVTIPGTFQVNIINGITTTGITTGQRITGDIIQSGTNITSVGINSITISKTTTNTSVATTTFTLYDLTVAAGAGASIVPSMGIGRVTVGVDTSHPLNIGVGTGYISLPGIAVTAVDGITGGGGIVTTTSFGIDTDCFAITNPGIYTTVPAVIITPPSAGGSAASANVGMGISTISVTSPGSYTGTKPTVSFSGGSSLVSAAATVTDIILNNLTLVNAGSGYTSGDIPVEATFSNVSLGATVGLGVEAIALTSPGLGYTVTPDITFDSPTLSGSSVATASATLANYGEEFNLLPGPGYGNTYVYYIKPTSSNTFELYRDIALTNKVVLGFSTLGNPIGYVGGEITDVEVTHSGSGYEPGDIISANATDLDNVYSSNVGTGFSFTATNIVQNYQISDLMILQSVGSANTTADIVEYGGITNLDDLVSFDADISGSNARLKVTPKYRDNTIKITRTSITN